MLPNAIPQPGLTPLCRFRPNFVVGGFPAYDEDAWTRVQVGGGEGQDWAVAQGGRVEERAGASSARRVGARCEVGEVVPHAIPLPRSQPQLFMLLTPCLRHKSSVPLVLIPAHRGRAGASNAQCASTVLPRPGVCLSVHQPHTSSCAALRADWTVQVLRAGDLPAL